MIHPWIDAWNSSQVISPSHRSRHLSRRRRVNLTTLRDFLGEGDFQGGRTGLRCAFSVSSPRPAKRTRPAILVIAYPDQRRQPGRPHLESTLNEEGTEEWDATHKQPGSRYCCYGWPDGCCCGRRRARCLDCCSTNRPAPASQRARPSGRPNGEAIIRQPK